MRIKKKTNLTEQIKYIKQAKFGAMITLDFSFRTWGIAMCFLFVRVASVCP